MNEKYRLVCACYREEIDIDKLIYYGDEKTCFEGKFICETTTLRMNPWQESTMEEMSIPT